MERRHNNEGQEILDNGFGTGPGVGRAAVNEKEGQL
jgi:hypothetical protein